jgi:hypothetical protein
MHLLHRVQTWNCEYEFVFFTSTYVYSCICPKELKVFFVGPLKIDIYMILCYL